MKHKILLTLAGLILVALVAGCGGKYSDFIETNKQFVKLMTAYVEAVDKVDNAGKAADAINKLADGMEKLAPKMKAMNEKYPELKNSDSLPEELEMSAGEMDAVGRKFGESFMKMIPYMMDKKVQEAQMRLTSIMSSIGQDR